MNQISQQRRVFALIFCLFLLLLPLRALNAQGSEEEERLEATAEVTVEEPSEDTSSIIDDLLQEMSPQERVGQLFLVTFLGDKLSDDSYAATLVRDLHVGGVVLRGSNQNYQNDNVVVTSLVTLTNGLQELASQENSLTNDDSPFIPLFIALDQVVPSSPYGDGLPERHFTELPSPMSVGATWKLENAELLGRIVGQELQAIGVNMFLGPTLDIVSSPHSDVQKSLGNYLFGDNPYWVGQMGRAFVRGIAEGGQGQVATVAGHFPGMGSSDRAPDDEIATVQKPREALDAQDLRPFFAVTESSTVISGTVDGLMSTNLRYRALQGNVSQTARPISLDAQNLPTLLEEPLLSPWRQAGGILVSDELGSPPLRAFYEHISQEGIFPARTVARDAFNAGNDLLFLANFALEEEDWEAQLENIKETIQFFGEQYEKDSVFATKVDESLRRLLALKLRLYNNDFSSARKKRPDPSKQKDSPLQSDESKKIVTTIAQEAATLLYPEVNSELGGLPFVPPLSDENLVIITDVRPIRDCSVCPVRPILERREMETNLLGRYGPESSGQLTPERITSLTFSQLQALLQNENNRSSILNRKMQEADWLIFLIQDKSPQTESDSSEALKLFLRTFNDRSQKLIVFSFGTPYYLDATELSKVTAYYALYSPGSIFVDIAGQLLFQEYVPDGYAPVSIEALNFDVEKQLSPDSAQEVELCDDSPGSPLDGCLPLPATLDLNEEDQIALHTSLIRDYNGKPVPDGTEIHFVLRYQNENLEQPRQTVETKHGIARTNIMLSREGQLTLSVMDDQEPSFDSDIVQITLQGGRTPIVIATVTAEPSITPTPTSTLTPSPTITPLPTITPQTPTVTLTPTPTPTATPSTRLGQSNDGFGWWTFLGTLVGLVVIGGIGNIGSNRRRISRSRLVQRSLMISLGGFLAYLVYVVPYALRLLPENFDGWGAIFFALIGGLLGLVRER
jgi:beta-N-acetylhexosaminidase